MTDVDTPEPCAFGHGNPLVEGLYYLNIYHCPERECPFHDNKMTRVDWERTQKLCKHQLSLRDNK